MGKTLVHEHVCYGPPGWSVDDSVINYDFDQYKNRASNYLQRIHDDFGVETIIDATPIDAGRNLSVMEYAARNTDVNIIFSTGLYPESRGASTYFNHRGMIGDPVDEIRELFVTELVDGVSETENRAGVIKVGTSNGSVTDYDRMILSAAARAQSETGAPIITHTENGTCGVAQLDILEEEGADVSKVMIGHIGNHDIDAQREITERGAFVAFDQLGTASGEQRSAKIEKIETLLREGRAENITLSHDYIINYLTRSAEVIYEALNEWDMSFVFENVIPELEARGIEEDVLRDALTANPQSLFE